MLGRDTEWRQGCVLTDEDALALGLVETLASGQRAVVISHDCDLPNDAELIVEVIIAAVVDKVEPMLAHARSPRRLHLSFSAPSGEKTCIELRHSDRKGVAKKALAEMNSFDGNLLLSPDEKRALKQWLAARYGRPAFPNAFEQRLRKTVGKKKVLDLIEKILEPASSHLVGLFFDLGEERTSEVPEGEPYFLSISAVYDAIEGGQAARETAGSTAAALQKLFEQAYGAPDTATEIALERCTAVADTFLTLADLRKVDQWRLEYISLREEPAGAFFAVGELPA